MEYQRITISDLPISHITPTSSLWLQAGDEPLRHCSMDVSFPAQRRYEKKIRPLPFPNPAFVTACAPVLIKKNKNKKTYIYIYPSIILIYISFYNKTIVFLLSFFFFQCTFKKHLFFRYIYVMLFMLLLLRVSNILKWSIFVRFVYLNRDVCVCVCEGVGTGWWCHPLHKLKNINHFQHKRIQWFQVQDWPPLSFFYGWRAWNGFCICF